MTIILCDHHMAGKKYQKSYYNSTIVLQSICKNGDFNPQRAYILLLVNEAKCMIEYELC